MAFALVIDDTVQAVGRLPGSARLLDTGQWFCPPGGLRNATEDERAACGWFTVIDSPPPFDEAAEVLERGDVVVVGGVPTVDYTVRAKTAEELAADAERDALETERRQVRKAIADLTAFIQLDAPTAAQTRAAVVLLAKIARRLIRDTYGDQIDDPTLPDLPAGGSV